MIKSWILNILTLGPTGFLPASGTIASFWGIALHVAFGATYAIWLGIFACFAGIALVNTNQEYFLLNSDPSWVVLDEFAGMLIALHMVPPEPISMGISFLLFRVLDIVKPFPVDVMENLPQGWGIFGDDMMAGLLTNICIRTIMFIFFSFSS